MNIKKLTFWLIVSFLSMVIDCMLINEILEGIENDNGRRE